MSPTFFRTKVATKGVSKVATLKHFSITEVSKNLGKMHMWVASNMAADIIEANGLTKPSRSTMSRCGLSGRIIGRRIGRHWFYYRPSVEAYDGGIYGNPVMLGYGKGIPRDSVTVQNLISELEATGETDILVYVYQKADSDYYVQPITTSPDGTTRILAERKID